MSKLGFGQVERRMVRVERKFLTQGIKLAQKEFKENFNSESNSETGVDWEDWKIQHPGQNKILVKDGKLKDESLTNKPVIISSGSTGTAILTIDPVDDRGRNYAAYHEESPSQGNNIQREFVTQSSNLDIKQK